jgi:aminopeptidase N/puromycin-sensitive aminopeptidase
MKFSSISSFETISAKFPAAFFVLLLSLISASGSLAQRLPSSVFPEHYALTLTPDLKAATFSGIESIDVRIAEPVNSITLNAAEIVFQSVTVKAGGKEQKAAVSLDAAKEQATFTLANQLPAGTATISIVYTGILNSELRGFYLSKTDRRNYAVTQFEPTDARRAFPSFDEPAFKATFDISLVVDAADTGISNSPIESNMPGPAAGKHTLRFSTTPKMSTYLVAFLVGDFQCSRGEQDGVAIRVCSTPDKVALTPYGVGVAKYVMHYLNNYFGIPYPLKKLDLIAIPDFEAGAMENFGAITYRETDLLIDEKTASLNAKKQVDIVIAHEMAHQWFGDLVTMQWWDNLWLNEGFATWMENKAVAAQHPEWNIDQTVTDDLVNTLNLDAQPTTRAIRAKADTPDEINQMFDGIAYGKASDVLLSVENYVGEETFRKGVHNYLAAHPYSNATAEDFWNQQAAASHKPVDKIMESLVAQPGVPIITFGDPVGGKISVTQKRFFLSPSIQKGAVQRWTLPVCFKSDGGKQECSVLTPSASTLNVPLGKLFFANAGGKSYYRTAYSPSEYDAILANIESALTPSERISFIGDEWAQVRSNKSSVGKYLNLVAAVKDDPNAEVVSSALVGYHAAYSRIAASAEEKAALQAWVRATFEPVYTRLGPPTESDSANVRQLRSTLFAALGDAKDPAILKEARNIAYKYISNPASVDGTFAQTALAIAAHNGDADLFEKLQKLYETSKDPEIQVGALHLLAVFEDPTLVKRALDYAISDKVRNQDAAIQLAIPLSLDESRDQAWKYIQANWDKVQTQLTTNSGSILIGSTGGFCSNAGREEVERFFAAHKVAASGQSLKHAIEHIDGCIELRVLQEPQLKAWLASQQRSALGIAMH